MSASKLRQKGSVALAVLAGIFSLVVSLTAGALGISSTRLVKTVEATCTGMGCTDGSDCSTNKTCYCNNPSKGTGTGTCYLNPPPPK